MNKIIRFLTVICLLGALALPGRGQQEKAPKGGKSQLKFDAIPGYKKQVIEGFTLLVNEEVLKPGNSNGFDRKPLEVLEMELKMITSMLQAKALGVLRNLPIWVEWDERQMMGNGREGNALAVYYGGHQSSMLRQGLNPLKANTVVILRMVSLTREHQPKVDSKRCVLLHEMAHAVHHQLFGYENPSIKQAYKQAMERKLYDRSSYAATNDAEYFAELTCAYLTRIDYFPHDREGLKKQDKAGFALMEQIWGKASKPLAVQKANRESPIPSSSDFDLDMSAGEIKLGRQLSGNPLQSNDLEGKTILAILHRPGRDEDLATFSRLEGWIRELEDYGLVILVNGVRESKEDTLVRDWNRRGLKLPLFQGTDFGFKKSERFLPPHGLVFDASGKCVFRGDASSTEKILRWLMGQQLAGKWVQDPTAKVIQPLIDSLETGMSPSQVIARALPLTNNPSKEVADQAKELVSLLTVNAKKRLEATTVKVETEPLASFVELEKLSSAYKGTAIASKAAPLLTKLGQNKEVQREKQARLKLEVIRKLDSILNGKEDSFDPFQPAFRQANRVPLAQLQEALRQMDKSFSGTPSAKEAAGISARWIPGS